MSIPTRKDHIYKLHSLITLTILLGFGHLPPFGPITPYGMQVLGIFLGLVYGWTTVGTIWPSLVGIIAMGFTDRITVIDAIGGAAGNDVAWQLLFIMAMLAPIEKEGVALHISKFFLSLRITKGRPWVFTGVFLFATYILSAATSGAATILLMWAILYSVLESVGFEPWQRYTSLMIFGVVYAAMLGFSAFPFKGMALAILRAYTAASGIVVDNALYMLVVIPITVVLLAGYVLMMRFLFKPDLTQLVQVDLEAYFAAHQLDVMDRRQKVLLGILISSVLLMFLPSLLPESWYVTQFLVRLGTSGVMFIIIAFMVAVKVDGQPLIDFETATPRIEWGIFFLVMSALYVAGELATEETGITELFYWMLYPLLGGRSMVVFILLGVIAGFIICNIGNNTAMGVVMMPIIHAFTMDGAYNPLIPVTLVATITFVAVLTPGASPHAALLHGNKDWINVREVYVYGVLVSVWSILVVVLLGTPLARMVFG